MRRPALVLLGFLMLFAMTATKAQTPGAASKPATGAPNSSVAPKPIHLPLFFEANRGQADSRVQFMARGKGYTLLLTPTETVLAESQTQVSARSGALGPFQNSLIATKTYHRGVIRMQLVGANSAPAMTGLEALPGKVNYLIGNDPTKWQTQVPLYSQARTEQVYPGVDLLFHGDERQLEYDFVVAPGADPSKIAFRIRGAARTKIDAHGDLVLHTTDSDFVMHKPVVYQMIASERRPIESSFVKRGKNEVAFRLGAYDHSQSLVIDPAIGFSSFLGGASEDVSGGFAVDDSSPGSPKLYLSGFTLDSTTFPEKNGVTVIGSNTSGSSIQEVGFVAKVDPTASGASSLVYLTFIGGSVPSLSTLKGCLSGFVWLALDKSQGAANIEPVLGGETNCANFPSATVLNPVTDPSGTSDGLATMAVRLMPSGAAIDKAATLGGNNDLGGGFIAVGTGGNVILSGETHATNLPTKNAYVNAFDNGATPAPSDDCFVTILNRADLSISYLTYLNVGGGSTSGKGAGCGAFEDASGNILAGGNTVSATAFNLGPGGTSLANGFQTAFGGTQDTFAIKLNTSLVGVNQLLYATYFGGGGATRAGNGSFDLGNGVVAIVGGTTSNSANGDIPLKNAFQTKNNATGDGAVGFLVLINTMQTGTASLQCGTYFGGSGGDDIVSAVTYDAGDPTNYRIILGGRTNSATDFPTLNPIQPYVGAVVGGVQSADAFLSILRVPTPNQTAFNATLVFSTYIGGSNPPAQANAGTSVILEEDDRINAVAVDANHTVYAAGVSDAPGGFFTNTNPTTTVNGFQTTCASCNVQSPLFPEDDVVVFSIGTGANATLQSIAVTPTTASIAVGQTQQFSAVGNFNDGTEKDITSLVTWTTVPTGFATMSTTSPGLATGTAVGSTAVTPNLGTATVLNTGALTVTAGAGADLAITKTGPSSIALGANLPYVITVTNNGPQDATGVVMTDPVPGNLSPNMVVASETCTRIVQLEGPTTLSCAIGALANGASTQISYFVTPTVAGSLTNTATVAGSSTDPNMGNNSASVTTTIGAGTATHFSVTAPGTATAGTAFSVTVTALDASNAVVTGYTGTVHFTSSDGQAVLPANSTLTNGVGTFSVTLKTAGAQTIAATDTVTASITGVSGTITVTGLGPAAMLAISKTHTGNFTQGQHSAQYTVTVSNGANAAATSGTVTVTDTALSALAQDFAASFSGTSNPNGVWSYGQFVESTSTFTLFPGQNAASPTCGLPYWSGTGYPYVAANNSGSPVTCGTPTIPNDTLWMHPMNMAGTDSDVRFTAPASGTYEITGSFVSLDTTTTLDSILVNGTPVFSTFICNPGNGETCAPTNTRAPFSVVKTLSAGNTVDFIVNCCSGSDQTFLFDSTGLSGAIDSNLSGLSLVSMFGAGWTCGPPNPANTCTRSDVLAPGAAYPPITVLVNVGVNASSPQVNTVSVSGGGSATANASDSTVITPAPSAQLTIAKTHTGNFTQGQQGAQYSLTIANSPGTTPTTGTVTVTETAPSGLTLVSMAGTGWTCGGSNAANVCTRADALAGGASYPVITVSVNVAANATSPQVNTAAVSGGGSAPANASDSTVIVSGSMAATHFSVTAPATATPGTPINFTVTALDASNATATGYTGTVHFTSSDGNAALPANSTLTNGVGTFQVTLNTVGNQTIAATDTVTGSITGVSGNINVSTAATVQLTVQTAGTGTGTVTGNGINCVSGSANACMASLPAGTQVVLTQAVTNGSTFAGWNGAPTSCTVAGATCSFTMPGSAETVTATFTAAAATLKSIAVTPANPTEPISSSVQFTATGTFSDNSTKDITATVTWASSNTEAATINAAGLVTVGGTAGLTTTISATLNEVTGSTLLTVSSSPISISVTPPAGGTFPPVPPGGTLAIGIVLTSTPGFSGTVTFGCTTSSPTITCAPDPATVTLTPTGPTDVAIVLNTFCKGTTTTGSVPMPGGFGGGFTLLLLSLTLGGVLWMWRRSPRWAVSFAILVLMAIGGASCASPPKGPNGATQPGNYTVTFSATVNGVTTSTAPIPFTVE